VRATDTTPSWQRLSRLSAGIAEELGGAPAVGGEPGRHRRSTRSTVLPEAAVWPTEMVVGMPPGDLALQSSGGLSGGPGAAGECGDTHARGQIHSLDEGGLQLAAPAQRT